jgi:regulator of protease activity HflC (stomatin/prohibitin superfamily)
MPAKSAFAMREDIFMRMSRGVSIAIGAIAVFFVLTAVFGSWYTIDQGERGVVLRNGAFIGTADPGLGFKLPIFDVVHVISVQTHAQVYEQMESYSRDQQLANLRVSVNYRIPPDQVATVYATYGSEGNMVMRLLDRLVPQETKIVFGRFNAVAAIQERARLNAEVSTAITDGIADAPIIVESVQIEDIAFSEAYENSIEQRMLAEVEVQRIQQNADREEVQAQITVIQAQARADAVRAEAQAQADAIKLRGEAEAAAINARGAALQDNPLLVELTKAERWNGTLPVTMIPGSTVPFLNVE